MAAIYAGLITVLFSAWVWDLKTQVDSVRRVHPTCRGRQPVMRNDPTEVTAAHTSHVVHPNPTHISRAKSSDNAFSNQAMADAVDPHIARHNGIPVWVIE